MIEELPTGDLATHLDYLANLVREALSRDRHDCWAAGDRVNRGLAMLHDEAIAQHGDPDQWPKRLRAQLRRDQRRWLGEIAAGMHVTVTYLRQLAAVSGTFGEEQRHLDRAWALYRAVLHAAHRTQQDARALLDQAIEHDWTVSDLNAMGRETPAILAAGGTCSECGAATRVRIEGTPAARADLHQLDVRCPVCVALALLRGTDGREASSVGALQ